MVKEFKKRNWNRHSKLGKKRKNKVKWKRPKGRHNKMRLKRKGYPARVGVGHKKDKKMKAVNFLLIKNVDDLDKVKKSQIVMIGHVGKKNKIEIMKRAKEMKIDLHKVDIDSFINKHSKAKKETEAKK